MTTKATTTTLIVYPGFKALEAVGPLTVFETANEHCAAAGISHRYALSVHSEQGEETQSSSSMRLSTLPLPSLAPDTCLVVGSPTIVDALAENQQTVHWLSRHVPNMRRCAGMCTGGFFLAEAGLLKGRQATTHWRYAEKMRDWFNDIHVTPDSIFVQSDNIWTSAGVSAALDLTLAFVQADCGHAIALEVARELVIYLRRPGGQSQFAGELSAKPASSKAIVNAQAWILNNLGQKLTIEDLSDISTMSSRNFRRAFQKEVGKSPSAYITEARIDRAKALLRNTDLPIKSISYDCGFASNNQMRTHFKAYMNVTPREYRERFCFQTTV